MKINKKHLKALKRKKILLGKKIQVQQFRRSVAKKVDLIKHKTNNKTMENEEVKVEEETTTVVSETTEEAPMAAVEEAPAE